MRSNDYPRFVAAPTTGLITPYINGLNSNGTGPDLVEQGAFDAMQEVVASLQPGDVCYLSAWGFDPGVPLTAGAVGPARTWGELFQSKAGQGVPVRILLSEFDPIFAASLRADVRANLAKLDRLVDGLPAALRGHLQYQVSLHPAVADVTIPLVGLKRTVHPGCHHQKSLVVRRGGASIAFCGGLDIAFRRTRNDWSYAETAAWHDLHVKVEGLLARDLASEFVQRWNRERLNNPDVQPRRDWGGLERITRYACPVDGTADRNPHRVQMHRTVSVRDESRPPKLYKTTRDDVWQGYAQIVEIAEQFLYLENQYFRDLRLADRIVARARASQKLRVIAVVPAELDEGDDVSTRHGNWLQHQFFERLTQELGTARLRIYTMVKRFIHSKLVLADDRVMSIGSANANPRGFGLDSELNVAVSDEKLVGGFRQRLWAHNLGVPASASASWKVDDFFARWDQVAAANQALVAGKTDADLAQALPGAAGECVVPFDYTKLPGKKSELLPDEVASLGSWGRGTLTEGTKGA